jgi:hypothetical protein
MGLALLYDGRGLDRNERCSKGGIGNVVIDASETKIEQLKKVNEVANM